MTFVEGSSREPTTDEGASGAAVPGQNALITNSAGEAARRLIPDTEGRSSEIYVSSEYSLEKAKLEDIDEIIEILEEGKQIKKAFDDKSWDRHPEYTDPGYIENLITNELLYVSKKDGIIIATLAIYDEEMGNFEAYTEDRDNKWGEYVSDDSIYLHMFCTRKTKKISGSSETKPGVSQTLLAILIQQCQDNNIPYIRCDCDASSPLVGYYRRLGFEPIDTVYVVPRVGEEYTAALLQLKIPKPDQPTTLEQPK